MSVIFDIIVVAIIATATFIGYKQGLVKSAIKILSFFIAIIVALILYKPITNIITENTSIDDKIKNVMIDKLKVENANQEENMSIQESIENTIIDQTTDSIVEMADTLTTKLIEIIVLLIIYILLKIALKFVSALTDLITKLPLLNQLNKVGGIVYGVIRGFIIVYTILLIVYLTVPLMNKNITDGINNSIITKTMYNNNIVLNIML